jgi:hypothetical protein
MSRRRVSLAVFCAFFVPDPIPYLRVTGSRILRRFDVAEWPLLMRRENRIHNYLVFGFFP